MLDYAFQRLEGVDHDLNRLLSVEKECQDQFTIVALCEEQDFYNSVINLLS